MENDDLEVWFESATGNQFHSPDEEDIVISSSSDSDVEDVAIAHEPFDIRLPASHLYLKSSELGELSAPALHNDPGTTISVPLMVMEVVLLPGQTLPLHFAAMNCFKFIRDMAERHSYFCLMSRFAYFDEEENHFMSVGPLRSAPQIGTLFEVKNVGVEVNRLTMQAVGRQRCALVGRPTRSELLYNNYQLLIFKQARVRVLNEVELSPPDFHHLPDSRALNRMPKKLRHQFFSHVSSHCQHVIQQSTAPTLANWLKEWLQKWFELSRVNAVLNQGYTVFSYWVAANLPADLKTKLSLLEEPCTDRRLRIEWHIASQINSLACSECGDVKFNLDDVINLSVEGNGTHFVNPGGFVHEMFTVTRVENVELNGRPSSEFSWFPGYAWTVLQCACCAQHLGWRFSSSKLLPKKFYGITRRMLKLVTNERDAEMSI